MEPFSRKGAPGLDGSFGSEPVAAGQPASRPTAGRGGERRSGPPLASLGLHPWGWSAVRRGRAEVRLLISGGEIGRERLTDRYPDERCTGGARNRQGRARRTEAWAVRRAPVRPGRAGAGSGEGRCDLPFLRPWLGQEPWAALRASVPVPCDCGGAEPNSIVT